jgi:hypothetical protein
LEFFTVFNVFKTDFDIIFGGHRQSELASKTWVVPSSNGILNHPNTSSAHRQQAHCGAGATAHAELPEDDFNPIELVRMLSKSASPSEFTDFPGDARVCQEANRSHDCGNPELSSIRTRASGSGCRILSVGFQARACRATPPLRCESCCL